MSTTGETTATGHYLAVFTSNKTSAKWRAWYAKTEEEKRATDAKGLAAVMAWDEKRRDSIVIPASAAARSAGIQPRAPRSGLDSRSALCLAGMTVKRVGIGTP